MGAFVKYRVDFALEHFKILSLREYAVFSAMLALQTRSGKHIGRVGTRTQIANRLEGKRASVFRAIKELLGRKYLREDSEGVIWVNNPNGGESEVEKIENVDKPVENLLETCEKAAEGQSQIEIVSLR